MTPEELSTHLEALPGATSDHPFGPTVRERVAGSIGPADVRRACERGGENALIAVIQSSRRLWIFGGDVADEF